MVQCDYGLDTTVSQRLNDINVMLQLFFAEFPFLGLNAAPFDRETMSVMVETLGEVKILLIQLVVAAGSCTELFARLLFPLPPVA